MKQFSFEATGTQWVIVVDQEVELEVFEEVKRCAVEFEGRFSRFREDSEIGVVNAELRSHPHSRAKGIADRDGKSKAFFVSDGVVEMLRFGKELQEVTGGAFDLNVASILEGHGYDRDYSFRRNEQLLGRERGKWEMKIADRRSQIVNRKTALHAAGCSTNWKLTTNGFVQLDLGAFGKGYLIDQIAKLLDCYMVEHYLIDGGRDFCGTCKSDGSAWVIGLEHPFNEGMAVGEFALKNGALACSGVLQRKVKDFHHFMDTKTGRPMDEPVGVFVSAHSAMVADGVSTAVAVSSEEYWSVLMSKYGVQGAVVKMSGELVDYGLEGLYR